MKRWFVISMAFALALPPLALAQSSTQKKDQGPRALALLQLAPDGTSRLLPVVIMYNGDFFDASAYKADPVPMALDSGTVYEAFRTGSSQGLFTIKQAVQAGTLWSARGSWQNSAALAAAAERKKKKAEEKPPTIADDDKGPPKLLRRSTDSKSDSKPDSKTTSSASKPSSTENQPPPDSDDDPDRPQLKRPQQTSPANAPATPSAQTPAPAQPQSSQPQSSKPQPTQPQPTQSADAKPAPAPAATPDQAKPDASEVSDEEDPNRPKLERGKTAQAKSDPFKVDAVAPVKAPTAASGNNAKTSIMAAMPAPNIQEIPAISDAGGPDPHSYLFPLKAGEDEQFRKKMLAQATQVIRTQLKEKTSEASARTSARTTTKSKPATRLPEPTYQDVHLRVFDLSSSNQPILVLEANVQVPGREEQQHITLVARQDLYGELHNSLANLTDMKHFDTTPLMDLIDVVDADGDGRGELLFRETSDQGHAYSIYRVIGDQLYQLYESSPQ
jgi:hypothetical protein